MQNLTIIPALLHAALLALLTGAVPLKGIATATCIAISQSSDLIVEPSPREASQAQSLHVLAFTSDDELLVAESEGSFTAEEFRKVLDLGAQVCCRDEQGDEDVDMGESNQMSKSVRSFVRSVMKMKSERDMNWT